jgi:ankyrin repeat protein
MKHLKIILIFLVLAAFMALAWADEIHEAAREADLNKVKDILEKNPQLINIKDKEGRTPLYWASRGVHIEMIKLLIEKGADVNARDKNNITALHNLASQGHKEAAELLIAKGADLNIKDNAGWIPLNYAIIYGGHREVVKLLISKGSDINNKDKSNQTPLLYAIYGNHKEVVNLLIDNNVQVPIKGENGKSLLHRAASGGHKRLVQLMLSKGIDISSLNADAGTLLHTASAGGLFEIVKMTIKEGFSINRKNVYGFTPLHIAVSNGHIDIVELLLNKGADVNCKNAEGKTAFHIAKECAQKEISDILLAKGAEQNPVEFPILKGKFLGQKKPGLEPELFAPGIVSTPQSEHSVIVFNSVGNEAFWSSGNAIFSIKMRDNQWLPPQVATFSGKFRNYSMAYSSDGNKLYFCSLRPLDNNKPASLSIWVVTRKGSNWSEAKPLGSSVNSKLASGPSLSNDDTLYFYSDTEGSKRRYDIYRSLLVNGDYTIPLNCSDAINSKYYDMNPYIAPDESYMIFESDRPEGFGWSDLYISFRKKDGTWSKAKNMGNKINTNKLERYPNVSSDGKYLFFSSDRLGNLDIYWVDAQIIEELKQKEQK